MTSRHRLRGRRRFSAVRTVGSRASSGAVRVTVAPNQEAFGRVGFALPGLRSAVERNRLRRRLREAVRPLLPSLAGHDAVVTAGADAVAAPYASLRHEVRLAFDRALRRSSGSPNPPRTDNALMTAGPGPT